MDDYNAFLAGMAKNTPKNINEYIGPDGIRRCRVCKQPTRTKIHVPGYGDFEPSIPCGCDMAAETARKERERADEIDRKRRICFDQPPMRKWTFENDDLSNAKLSESMRRYCESFDKLRKDGKGLLLFGSVGSGKSYYAACIANRLIEMGYSAKMTNFATLNNDLQGRKEGRNEYIQDLNSYSLLVLDDLGAERNSSFMQEIVFNIIDSRCRSGLPMIVTTNLSGDELKNPANTGEQRIYDRLLGCCTPVEVSGPSRRRKQLRESYEEMRELLGI